MEAGNIVEWHIKEGEEVMAGAVLADIETDKATLGFESMEDGYMAKILVPGGTKDVVIGTPVAIMVEEEADIAAFADYTVASTSSAAPAATSSDPQAATSAPSASSAPAGAPRSTKIGPAAKSLLASAGLSMEQITPTGPQGIITKGDVLAAIASGVAPAASSAPAPASSAPAPASSAPAPAASSAPPPATAASTVVGSRVGTRPRGYVDVPVTQMRHVIAARLLESKTTIPGHYMTKGVALDAVASLRGMFKAGGRKVSVNDMVIKATALALRDVPNLNAGFDAKTGSVVPNAAVDVSIAVATPGGLITPIVKGADAKSVLAIGDDVRDLATRARENKLAPEEFMGGSFTISNLGMFGVKEFSAIINPPQAAIMAVGGSDEVLALGTDGAPTVTQRMNVTLTTDARVADAATVARFLEAFAFYMESPVALLTSELRAPAPTVDDAFEP